MSQKQNRFSCLKSTEDNSIVNNQSKRTNRFQGQSKVTNSRWQRSKSPERSPEKNSFQRKKREGDDKDFRNNNNRKYNKGGFGKFRYNHGRGGPSVFDGVKKDIKGRPMIQGAITAGFDIGAALQQSKNIKKSIKRQKATSKKVEKNNSYKKEKWNEKTEEEKKAEAEWNKQMILNMQYETESEDEDYLSDAEELE